MRAGHRVLRVELRGRRVGDEPERQLLLRTARSHHVDERVRERHRPRATLRRGDESEADVVPEVLLRHLVCRLPVLPGPGAGVVEEHLPGRDRLVPLLALEADEVLRGYLVDLHGVVVQLVILLERARDEDELARRALLHLAALLVIEHVEVVAPRRAVIPAHPGLDDALRDRLLRRRHEVRPGELALLHRVRQAVDLVLGPAQLRQDVLAVVDRPGLGVLRDRVGLAFQLHRVPQRGDNVLELALVLLEELIERDDIAGGGPRGHVLVPGEDDVGSLLRLGREHELLLVVVPAAAALERRVDLDRRLRSLIGELLVQRLRRGHEVVAPVVRGRVRADRPRGQLDRTLRKIRRRPAHRSGAARRHRHERATCNEELTPRDAVRGIGLATPRKTPLAHESPPPMNSPRVYAREEALSTAPCEQRVSAA